MAKGLRRLLQAAKSLTMLVTSASPVSKAPNCSVMAVPEAEATAKRNRNGVTTSLLHRTSRVSTPPIQMHQKKNPLNPSNFSSAKFALSWIPDLD